MRTPEPTKADPGYYPRIKINRRWYLIVPEIDAHDGCAFRCDKGTKCRFVEENLGDYDTVPMFDRHDCGIADTIFVKPAKFPEYLATIAAIKLEGKP